MRVPGLLHPRRDRLPAHIPAPCRRAHRCGRRPQRRPTEDGAESIIVELPARKASCRRAPSASARSPGDSDATTHDAAAAATTRHGFCPAHAAMRTPQGEPLCSPCMRRDPVNHETRTACGRLALLLRGEDGAGLCTRRWRPPLATCSSRGDHKPCHNADTDSPRCPNCTARLHQEPCKRCGTVRPVWGRAEDGSALCEACTRHKEPCHICGQVRPVHGRPPDGPLCKSDTSRSVWTDSASLPQPAETPLSWSWQGSFPQWSSAGSSASTSTPPPCAPRTRETPVPATRRGLPAGHSARTDSRVTSKGRG